MADDTMQLPPGYEDAKPVQAKQEEVQLPPGYEDAKPVVSPVPPPVKMDNKPTDSTKERPFGFGTSVKNAAGRMITHPWEAVKTAADYWTRPDEKKPETPPKSVDTSVPAGGYHTEIVHGMARQVPNYSAEQLQAKPSLDEIIPGRELSEKGGKLGLDIGHEVAVESANIPNLGAPAYAPYVEPPKQQLTSEEVKKQFPARYGIAGGVGKTVLGMASDPTNIALLGTMGVAGPVLNKVVSLAFAANMGHGTLEGVKQLRADWDGLQPDERWERITELGIQGLFAEECARHFTAGVKPGGEVANVLAGRDTAGEPALPTVKKIVTAPVRNVSDVASHIVPAAPYAAGALIGHPYVGARILSGITDPLSDLVEKGRVTGLSPKEAAYKQLEERARNSAKEAANTQAAVDRYKASVEQKGAQPPEDVEEANIKAQTRANEDRFHADAAREAMEKAKPKPPISFKRPPKPAEVPTEQIEAKPGLRQPGEEAKPGLTPVVPPKEFEVKPPVPGTEIVGEPKQPPLVPGYGKIPLERVGEKPAPTQELPVVRPGVAPEVKAQVAPEAKTPLAPPKPNEPIFTSDVERQNAEAQKRALETKPTVRVPAGLPAYGEPPRAAELPPIQGEFPVEKPKTVAEATAPKVEAPVQKAPTLEERGAAAVAEHPQQGRVNQVVFELGNDDLRKAATNLGIDTNDPQYKFGAGVKRTEANEAGHGARVQTGRKALAEAVANKLSDEQKTDVANGLAQIEKTGLWKDQDISGSGKAARSRALLGDFLKGKGEEGGQVVAPGEAPGVKEAREKAVTSQAVAAPGAATEAPAERAGYGERNRGVTKEEKDAAVKRLLDKFGKGDTGIIGKQEGEEAPGESLRDATKIAQYHYEALGNAAADFGKWSAEMVKSLGEAVKPHLEELWKYATNPLKILGPEAANLGEAKVNPNPVDPRPPYREGTVKGDEVTPTHHSYGEAVENKGNVLARMSADPKNDNLPNEKRTLLVQFASDLINKANLTKDASARYADKLYSGAREGYSRLADFWEIPHWIAFVSYFLPDADVYVVRDMAEAKNYLNHAGYGDVAVSVLDTNKHLVRDLFGSEDGYKGKVHAGGYIQPEELKDLDHVKWHNSLEDMAKDMGVPYKYGVDYRHFAGSEVIPRLSMSTGCSHKCLFCVQPREVVEVPWHVVLQQADAIADQLKSPIIYLNDKTWGQASNAGRLGEVFDRIKQKNPDFQGFVVQTTAAELSKMSPEFLLKSGVKAVELGVESFNDEILSDVKKPAREWLINKCGDILRKAKVSLIPNIMIGLPGETAATYADTLGYLNSIRDIMSHGNLFYTALYEGSGLAEKVKTLKELLGGGNPGFGENDHNENALNGKSWITDPTPAIKFNGDAHELMMDHLNKQTETAKANVPKFTSWAHNENKGFTYNPKEGLIGNQKVFSVAGEYKDLDRPIKGEQIKPEDIKAYMEDPKVKAALAADPRNSVGGYVYKGNSYLEVSKLFHDKGEAIKEGQRLNQHEIYDHANKALIPTGGTAVEALHQKTMVEHPEYAGEERRAQERPAGMTAEQEAEAMKNRKAPQNAAEVQNLPLGQTPNVVAETAGAKETINRGVNQAVPRPREEAKTAEEIRARGMGISNAPDLRTPEVPAEKDVTPTEPLYTYYGEHGTRIELTKEDAESVSQGGKDASEDVAALRKVPYVAKQLEGLNPEDVRAELKETGAWSEEELKDDDENLNRLLWQAGGDIKEHTREAPKAEIGGVPEKPAGEAEFEKEVPEVKNYKPGEPAHREFLEGLKRISEGDQTFIERINGILDKYYPEGVKSVKDLSAEDLKKVETGASEADRQELKAMGILWDEGEAKPKGEEAPTPEFSKEDQIRLQGMGVREVPKAPKGAPRDEFGNPLVGGGAPETPALVNLGENKPGLAKIRPIEERFGQRNPLAETATTRTPKAEEKVKLTKAQAEGAGGAFSESNPEWEKQRQEALAKLRGEKAAEKTEAQVAKPGETPEVKAAKKALFDAQAKLAQAKTDAERVIAQGVVDHAQSELDKAREPREPQSLGAAKGGAAKAKAKPALPTDKQLLDKYGEAAGPGDTSLITADGTPVHQGGFEHESMLNGGPGDNQRERFINEQNGIRMRTSGVYGDRQFALTMPKDITKSQLSQLHEWLPQLKTGRIYIERPEAGSAYGIVGYGEASEESLGKALKDAGIGIKDVGPQSIGAAKGGAAPAKIGWTGPLSRALTWDRLPEIAKRNLTQEEWEGLNTPQKVGKFVSVLANLPEVKELTDLAWLGRGARKWYERSTGAFKAIMKVAPEMFDPNDAEGDFYKFTGTIAGGSPRQTVAMNLREALVGWSRWVEDGREVPDMDKWKQFIKTARDGYMEAGKPDDMIPAQFRKALSDARKIYREEKDIADAPMFDNQDGMDEQEASDDKDFWEYKPDDVTQKQWDHMSNALRGKTMWDFKPKGNEWGLYDMLAQSFTSAAGKVPNVIKALRGEPLWPDLSKNANFKVPSFHENIMGVGKRVTNDGWMGLIHGLDPKEITKPESYHPMSVIAREVGNNLGWKPEETQAALWAFAQTFVEHGETEPHIIAQYSQDFADLVQHDPEVRQILSRLFKVNLGELDEHIARTVTPKPEITPGTEAVSPGVTREFGKRIEAAGRKQGIPKSKSEAQLDLFKETPAGENRNRVSDESTGFNPAKFQTQTSGNLEPYGNKKKGLKPIK